MVTFGHCSCRIWYATGYSRFYLVRSHFYATLMTFHPRSHLMFDSLLTTASFIGSSEPKLTNKSQEDLTKLERWADTWAIKYNPSKCSILWVKKPRAKEMASDYQLSFRLSAQGSDTRTSIKYTLLRSQHHWEPGLGGSHLDIVSKANLSLGFLRINLKGCPSKIKEKAYFSIVMSLLEYSCPV